MSICIQPWITAYIQQPDPHWSSILTAFLTPVIALLGVLIAFRQWRTARNKLKLDLYEKRLVIYEAVRDVIGKIVTHGKIDQEIEREFLIGIRGSKWLFNKDMVRYLEKELWTEISKIATLEAMLDGAPQGDQKVEMVRKREEAMRKMGEELSKIDDRFYPFLSLSH